MTHTPDKQLLQRIQQLEAIVAAINPGGNTTEGASTINWSTSGQTIANGVTLTLNATRELTVICNGGASHPFHHRHRRLLPLSRTPPCTRPGRMP